MEEYIYIENYIKLTQTEKGDFLGFMMQKFHNESIDQVLVFSEESLLMSFFKEVDIFAVYECVEKYFKGNEDIKIDIANREDKKRLVLTYANKTINI
ncbi:hypothetical protein [Poseidonibacter sp.]|uniref:hypothetical protein n=1 Tax=Poseidonibacter sp. TaxID=2321188 RepID=UPI003C728BB4